MHLHFRHFEPLLIVFILSKKVPPSGVLRTPKAVKFISKAYLVVVPATAKQTGDVFNLNAIRYTLYANFPYDQAGVMAAKAERIAYRDIDFLPAGMQRYIVHFKIAGRVLIVQIDSGGDS